MIRRLAFAALSITALTACSRLGLDTTLSISMPFRDDQGGFAVDDNLTKTVVQIHIPGRPAPIVRVTNYQPGEVPRGQDFSMDLANVPRGTGYLIQFLGIYENTTNGALKFYYGDATGEVGSNSAVEITADNVAQSDTLIRAAGRYLTGPNSGPTGRLTAEFFPPNNKPVIKAGEFPINNGWFAVRNVDTETARLRFSVNGLVVFENLARSAPELSRLGPTLLRAIKPVSFYVSVVDGQTRPAAQTDIYLGFWGHSTGQQMCYYLVNEVVFGQFSDNLLTSPLEFRTTAANGLSVRIAGGGVGQTYASYPGSSCTGRFEHQQAAGDAPYAN